MLIDMTEDPLMRLLVDQTRRATSFGPDLARAHRKVGSALAPCIAKHLRLIETEIAHVQGSATGVSIASGEEPVILAMLRAGLFLAEGVWESFPTASLVLQSGNGAPVVALPAATGPLVLVDAVINSGRSVRELLCALELADRRPAVVATLVGFRPTMERLCEAYPTIEFVAARISDRSYVGRGATDTGSRLFGTTNWGTDRSH